MTVLPSTLRFSNFKNWQIGIRTSARGRAAPAGGVGGGACPGCLDGGDAAGLARWTASAHSPNTPDGPSGGRFVATADRAALVEADKRWYC